MAEQWGSSNSWTQPPSTSWTEPTYRSPLDRARTAGRTPGAEYPSGYLGTVNRRRDDRLLQALSRRQSQRNYTRGVHSGSRANPEGYIWPENLRPDRGLQAEAMGMRQRPLLEASPEGTRLTNDGKPMPRGAASLTQEDLVANLRKYSAPWK